MQSGFRSNLAASPVRRSRRTSSSHRHSPYTRQDSRASRRASTPKSLELGGFDADAVDPEIWNNMGSMGEMDFQGDFSGFDAFGLPSTDFDITHFDPRASMNLLQNPLSALPGVLESPGHMNRFVDATNHAYDFTRTVPSQPRTPLDKNHSVLDYPPVPSPSRRSSRNKTPVRDTFSEFPTPQYPIYEYPEPFDPRYLDNAPYFTAANHIEEDSLFMPESSGSGRSRNRSIAQANTSQRGRRSDSYPSSANSNVRSRSSLSSSGDDAHRRHRNRKSVFEAPFKYETPKLDVNKPWVRTNGTTKGLTTRTAKLNGYDPHEFYDYTPHPLGTWRTKYNTFRYTKNGELSDKTYSADQIRDFILHYPEDRANKIQLQLFIQVGPTDSARRYLSSDWTKCRFRECPVNVHEKGTILHGHYRVAFDERSFGTNNRYDPHLAASGYAHLYCMERFLDFEYICRKAHVKVDYRQFNTEPKGKFHATLAGRPECAIAQDFVKYAAKGTLRTIVPEFADYPVHSQYTHGRAKPHDKTLTAQLHKVKAATRPPAQIKQFQDRGLGVTHILVNKGDLELMMEEKMRKKAKTQVENAKRKQKRRLEELESSDEENVNAEYASKRRKMVAEAKRTYKAVSRKAPRHQSPPRKTIRRSPASPTNPGPYPWDEDDDESNDEDRQHGPAENVNRQSRSGSSRPARRSPRNTAKRVKYNVDSEPEAPAGYQTAVGPEADLSFDPYPKSADTHRRSSQFYDPEFSFVDIDALMAAEGLDLQDRKEALRRRQSSLPTLRAGRSGSIMRAPGSGTSLYTGRHASFNKQPVTQSRTFDTNAPPQDVEGRNSVSPRRTRQQSRAAQVGKCG